MTSHPKAPDNPAESNVDEQELVEGLRARDPKAYRVLIERYGPMVLGVTRRFLRDEADARDCVQETFLSVYRSADRFEGRARLQTWLRRIATNAALMRIRSRRSRPEDAIDPQGPTYDEFAFREGPRRANALTPDEILERAETTDLVRRAVDRLPEPYRAVLLLRDIEGHSTAEAAEMLDVSEGTVKTRLHRARTRLKEQLESLFAEDAS